MAKPSGYRVVSTYDAGVNLPLSRDRAVMGREDEMQFRTAIKIGMAVCSLLFASAFLGACATGGGSGGYKTFMQKCEESATTEQERSECAWKNAERNASGR